MLTSMFMSHSAVATCFQQNNSQQHRTPLRRHCYDKFQTFLC